MCPKLFFGSFTDGQSCALVFQRLRMDRFKQGGNFLKIVSCSQARSAKNAPEINAAVT